MVPLTPASLSMTRRYFFGRTATGIGTAALASLLNSGLQQNSVGAETQMRPGVLQAPHHAPTAKRVIYLFMSGAPSQMDLFDYKPTLVDLFDKDLPDSVIDGQRLTTMTSGQTRFPVAPSIYKFAQHGQSGIWMSELLPHLAGVADDLTVVKTVHTEAINHDLFNLQPLFHREARMKQSGRNEPRDSLIDRLSTINFVDDNQNTSTSSCRINRSSNHFTGINALDLHLLVAASRERQSLD